MFCIVTNRQPARHMCFAKRIAVHLSVFPRDVLLDAGDHGSVRTRITKQFIYPFPNTPSDPLSDEDHGDQPYKCKECWVEQLGSRSLWRITYCIGINNTWLHPYTSGALTHSFATKEHDVFCRPIIPVEKDTHCDFVAHTTDYVPALKSSTVTWPRPKRNAMTWILG